MTLTDADVVSTAAYVFTFVLLLALTYRLREPIFLFLGSIVGIFFAIYLYGLVAVAPLSFVLAGACLILMVYSVTEAVEARRA